MRGIVTTAKEHQRPTEHSWNQLDTSCLRGLRSPSALTESTQRSPQSPARNSSCPSPTLVMQSMRSMRVGALSTTPCTALTFLAIRRPLAPTAKNGGPGSSLTHASCSTTACRLNQAATSARSPTALRATPSSSPTKTGTKSTQPPLLSAGPAAPKHLPASWWPTTTCTCISSSTESIPSERPTPRASPMCDSNRPSPSSWTVKTPSHALMQKIRRLPIGIGLAFNARLSPKRSQKTAQPLRAEWPMTYNSHRTRELPAFRERRSCSCATSATS